MKKNIIVLSFLLIFYPIFSIEILDDTKTRIYNVNLSLGTASGGSIGIGKIQYCERSTKELIANFHYLINSDYYVIGIYNQLNSFRNKKRLGSFTFIKAGIDYTKGEKKPFVFVPGGPNPGDYDMQKFAGIFPILAIGCGFSLSLSQNSRMLIFFDLGIQKTFANLNVSVNF